VRGSRETASLRLTHLGCNAERDVPVGTGLQGIRQPKRIPSATSTNAFAIQSVCCKENLRRACHPVVQDTNTENSRKNCLARCLHRTVYTEQSQSFKTTRSPAVGQTNAARSYVKNTFEFRAGGSFLTFRDGSEIGDSTTSSER